MAPYPAADIEERCLRVNLLSLRHSRKPVLPETLPLSFTLGDLKIVRALSRGQQYTGTSAFVSVLFAAAFGSISVLSSDKIKGFGSTCPSA